MNKPLFTNSNFRCGEIFQRDNQEFFIICVLCNKEFHSYPTFTNHLIQKKCSSIDTPLLLQQTLKIEKDIIYDLLIEPKIEQVDIVNKKEIFEKVIPKIEFVEFKENNGQKKTRNACKSTNNKIAKESTKNSSSKLTKSKRIVKKKIIWDPDDPKIQLLCENYQNQSPKNCNKKSKEIVKSSIVKPKMKEIKPLTNKLEIKNVCNRKQLLVKTFPKQSRIKTNQEQKKNNQRKKRIKKVIWDPDAPEEDIYKSKTNIDSKNLEGIKLPSHAI